MGIRSIITCDCCNSELIEFECRKCIEDGLIDEVEEEKRVALESIEEQFEIEGKQSLINYLEDNHNHAEPFRTCMDPDCSRIREIIRWPQTH